MCVCEGKRKTERQFVVVNFVGIFSAALFEQHYNETSTTNNTPPPDKKKERTHELNVCNMSHEQKHNTFYPTPFPKAE